VAFKIEEVVGITTVGDLIAALEEFPDDLAVRMGAEERLLIRHVKPKADDPLRRRREFIEIEGDRDAG
jgi:hypothetical protein